MSYWPHEVATRYSDALKIYLGFHLTAAWRSRDYSTNGLQEDRVKTAASKHTRCYQHRYGWDNGYVCGALYYYSIRTAWVQSTQTPTNVNKAPNHIKKYHVRIHNGNKV